LIISEPDGTFHDYKFTDSAVPANKWTHVAIVYGTGTDNKQIFCYINGELKQKTSTSAWFSANPEVVDNPLSLGGDFRSLNDQAFRGTLGDVVVYGDVRTPSEILADSRGDPDLNDKDLMIFYDITSANTKKDIPDASGNGYDMTYYKMWLTEAEMEAIRKKDEYEYTYSLAFIPDIQYMTQTYPHTLDPLFDYLLQNKESKNIQHVLGLGDMTNANTLPEWYNVKRQYEKLNGKIPYSLVRGNHDILLNNKEKIFDQAFGIKGSYYYNYVKENGGFMDESTSANTYMLFTVGEIDYIILCLDFGISDEVVKWANTVLDEYPERRAILTTHGYLNADGTTLDELDYARPTSYDKTLNDGEEIWETLISKHDNVDMIVSGHMNQDNIVYTRREGMDGHAVYEILIDPQTTDKALGGTGTVAFMYFTEDGRHAKIEFYSTVLDKYLHESNAYISFDFDLPVKETEPAVTTATPETLPAETIPAAAEKGCGSVVDASVAFAVIMMLGIAVVGRRNEVQA
ncbi:MAG: metallophosphoesterase, partial [Clostridia bacterium]|nr:metallophosphoesterase [Clostridia bacterium]